MADSTISNLDPAGALTGAELVPMVQGGETVQDTLDNIKVFNTPTLSDVLGVGNKTGEQGIESDNGYSELNVVDTQAGMSFNDGSNTSQFTANDSSVISSWTDGVVLSRVLCTDTETNMYHTTKNTFTAPTNDFNGSLKLITAGNGLYIKEGTNATSGVATLVAGTIVVNTTKVTANSRIYLSVQALGTVVVPTMVAVTARTASTSFTITSANVADTSIVAWHIIEPA